MAESAYQPVSVSRRIEAPAARIFAVLADPRRHLEIDGSGMLRGPSSDGAITSAGEVFEIRHPEMAMLARSALVVVHSDAKGRPTDKVEYISYLHVASVETLAGAAA